MVLGTLLILCIASTRVAGASTIAISTTPTLKAVDPGTAAVFTLQVENTGPARDVVGLDMSGAPKNWTVLLSDDSLDLGAGQTKSTELTVKPGKDAMTSDVSINVTGTSTTSSSKASVIVKVHVNQVYKLGLQVSPVSATTAGGSTSIAVRVTNDGNGPDHVTISVIPTGGATSWATVGSVSYDMSPGDIKTYTQPLNVPSDTEPNKYQFIVRATSSGPVDDVRKTVDMDVQKGNAVGMALDLNMLILIVVIIFMVVILLLVATIPKKRPAAGTKGATTTGPKARKVKKVVRTDRGDHAEHRKHLERIEKRLEALHEKVERLHDGQKDAALHFEGHLAKHHGERTAVEPLPPPPKPSGELPPVLPPKDYQPGPHPEALRPEGPPENMSVGDDHGELRKKAGTERLSTAPPSKERTKCPKCGGDVEAGWIKCPTCSAQL